MRSMLAGVRVAMAALALTAGSVVAQTYPSKVVSLMVPYPAGGLSDAIARIVAPSLAKQLGQQVIVENLGGASGTIAAQRVLGAPADGHLVFQGSPNELILAPLAMASVKFKSEDFRLVQMIGVAPLAVIARKGLPANSVDELIALARKAAADGKPLTYGSVGHGSFYHVLGEHFAQTIGARMTHVPYKGMAPLLQDMGGEQVDFALLVVGAQTIGLADQGRLKILATLAPAGKVEAPFLKPYPSINESRQIKDFAFNIWTGYFVRKETPEPVVAALNQALGATLADPVVRGKLEEQGLMVATPLSVGEAAREYESQLARFRAIAKAIRLEAQ
ncbi:MAG: tripartite tricarboxylate transporter substrate binding protein [Sutterellaceae bacterium]|nr:tripartite tricarboxylate transporter substrate binding protein [Burkholderiaceae bacterium]MDW8430234.1 tripartite tricarboxylate transporter substrate binding protein [Sutterellaceae bacterium]